MLFVPIVEGLRRQMDLSINVISLDIRNFSLIIDIIVDDDRCCRQQIQICNKPGVISLAPIFA